MSDTTHDLLVRGIAAAKAGEIKEARFYFEWLDRLDPPLDEHMDAWYWLSQISTDPSEKRRYLEDMLANDPGDGRARRALAILDGKLKVSQIVDPEKVGQPVPAGVTSGNAQRMTCPKCGGRMTFTPDGASLVCEYCESRKTPAASSNTFIPEDDFVVALAQAKGHLNPVHMTLHKCQGCGATFLFEADQLSGACPYCESNYVVKESQSTDTILPNALAPFEIGEKVARQILDDWLAEKFSSAEVSRVSGLGVYLPVWTFDVGGQLYWSCEVRKKDAWVPYSSQKVILENDVLVPATRKIKPALRGIIDTFDLEKLVPYQPDYLSAWMAENHEISMADASLDARKITLDREKSRVAATILGTYQDLVLNSRSVLVDSYKLILLPIWMCHYSIREDSYNLVISGQKGDLLAETPKSGPLGWIEKIFNPS
jgi:DNA-directed RNA polymerase subunit RPC12/RpoP